MFRPAVATLLVGLTVLLAGCTTEAPPDISISSPAPSVAPTPTPIDGLPDDHTLGPVNMHTAAGDWAFIATASSSPVGVHINGLWKGQAGELADRSYSQPPDQAPVDVATAVPYFLSWSYVVLGGSTQVAPDALILPSNDGDLYNVGSAFSDHDCPDYQLSTAQGIGFLVTHCAVSLSPDDGYPVGLAFAVPGQTQQYWFMDAPAPVDAPPS
ncbi:MAG: hypothetical protein FWD80_06530 [Propionibacteriaceae bacterium]|nr:hypothetical protein [Propionibacteriaceae bacterium]